MLKKCKKCRAASNPLQIENRMRTIQTSALEIGKAHMKLLILGAGEYGQLVKELARNKYTMIDFFNRVFGTRKW